MKPIEPCPSANAPAPRGAVALAAQRPRAGSAASISRRTSALGSTRSRDHERSASSGMNSMKRTSYGCLRANSAKRTTSSSVKSLSATTLTLIGRSSGWRSAAASPSSTCCSESRRVSWKKRSGASASSDTFTRRRPARTSSLDLALEQVAVGGQREVVDVLDRRESISTSRHSSRRASGSPPVRRTSWTPIDASSRDQPRDLLVGEELVAVQPRQALGGHAVLAAEVAAVGDRDAHVADRAAVAVDELALMRGGSPTSRRSCRAARCAR